MNEKQKEKNMIDNTETNNTDTLGKRIMALRKAAGMTQEQVAERLWRRSGRSRLRLRADACRMIDACGVRYVAIIHHGVSFAPGPLPRFFRARLARLASRAACSARSIFSCRSLRRKGFSASSSASCLLSIFPACRSIAAAGSGSGCC